ncbi:MAG TPA: peptidylprolyl isomerase [Polyangiaceae bacterium]|nr:peptidylprolyl isomerase [Polyangiaceae bacterium]
MTVVRASLKPSARRAGMRGSCSLLACLAASCSAPEGQPKALTAQLPAGVVARVADLDVSARSVERIASAQDVSITTARNRAIRDALYARAARDQLPPEQSSSTQRAALARAVLEELLREARARGPASASELQAIVAERWFEHDRPASARTSHAVVLVASAADEKRAAALAQAIQSAVAGVKSVAEFKDRAQGVPNQGLEVRVEPLPFITTDGRSFYQDALRPPSAGSSKYDLDFARAANAIAEVGRTSPVTKTRFGYHVIYLEERLAEHRLTPEKARAMLGEEILSKRASRAESELLQALKRAAPAAVVRAADDLMARVPLTP